MACDTFTITDSTGSITLQKPYPGSLDYNLSMGSKNFAFTSGRFVVYVNEISDEGFVAKGFAVVDGDYKTCFPICFDSVFGKFCFGASDVSQKFDFINDAMDAEREVTISNLSDDLDAIYVIESFQYSPIPSSVDAFEYYIVFKYVRESD